MPLYAFDGEKVISAANADPFRVYHCIECRKSLRKRTGTIRRPHFYHLRAERQCRLYSRSEDHLSVQFQLKDLFASLIPEKPFFEICRVADLCWEEERLVFEIQCSQIEPDEVRQRERDYARAGFEIVWLLDDRLFNRRILRMSEDLIRSRNCYFLALRRNQPVVLYDQWEFFVRRRRVVRGPPLWIDLSSPISPPTLPIDLPAQVSARLSAHRKIFRGDLTDRVFRYPKFQQHLLHVEKRHLEQVGQRTGPQHWVRKGYFAGLEHLFNRLL